MMLFDKPTVGDLKPGDMLLWPNEHEVQVIISVIETVERMTNLPVRRFMVLSVFEDGRTKVDTWKDIWICVGVPAQIFSTEITAC
jgi:hypothetical protein